MKSKQNQTRCEAHNKAGKPCRAPAMADARLCYIHANPGKARHLGRLGGLKNRHFVPGIVAPLPTASTAAEVLKNATQILNDTYVGKIQPKVADSLQPYLSLQLRAIEILELEWYADRARMQARKAESEESGEKPSTRLIGSGHGTDSKTKSDVEGSSDETTPTNNSDPEEDS
jgi:hypothetical protein